jgi:hypothetical protein
MLWKACIMHVASECLWPHPLRTEAAFLPVVASSMAWIPHTVLGLCIFILLVVLVMRLGFLPCIWMSQPDMDRDPRWQISHSYHGGSWVAFYHPSLERLRLEIETSV